MLWDYVCIQGPSHEVDNLDPLTNLYKSLKGDWNITINFLTEETLYIECDNMDDIFNILLDMDYEPYYDNHDNYIQVEGEGVSDLYYGLVSIHRKSNM